MLKHVILFVIFVSSLFSLSASTEPDWEVQFKQKINWTKLTAGGILLVQHGQQLSGIDPKSQQISWTTPLGLSEISQEDIQEIPASPYVTIERPAGLIATKLLILDYFSGQPVFDSKEADIPRILESYPMFAAGGILLRTKGDGKRVQLVFIDLRSSSLRWSLSIDQKPEGLGIGGMMRMLKNTFIPQPILDPDLNIVYPTRQELMRIDAQTGALLWQLDLKKIEDLYFSPQTDRNLYVAFDKNKFAAIQLQDGTDVWAKPLKLKGDFVNMFPHGDGLVVIQTDLISKIDARTGKDVWKKEPKLENTYHYLQDGQHHLFVVSEDGKDKSLINAYDLNSGAAIWKKEIKVKAPVESFSFTPKGILYLSGGGSNIIDPANGSEYWRKDLKLKGQPIFLNDSEEGAYLVYGRGKLYRIDTQSGEFVLLREGIQFEGKQEVEFIEKRKEGYLLGSSQNLMLLASNGRVLYHTYLPAHTGSVASKLGVSAVKLASQYYTYQQAYQANVDAQAGLNNWLQGDLAATGKNIQQVEQHMNRLQLGAEVWQNSNAIIDRLYTRFKSNFESSDDMFLLTSDKGVINKPVFAQIAKTTGEELARYDLKNAEPIYNLDEIDRLLYLVNGKTVEVYTL